MEQHKYKVILWLCVLAPMLVKAQQSLPDNIQKQLLLGQVQPVLPQLQEMAVAGNGKASFVLGALYAKGEEVPRDLAKARKWLLMAQSQGSQQATALLKTFKFSDQLQAAELFKAIESDNLNLVMKYIANDDDKEPGDKQGNTPLLLAIKQGKQSIVRYLLASGKVDVNAQDNLGRSPLHWALIAHNEVLAQQLLSHKADPKLPDIQGTTPKALAKRLGLKLVLQHQPSVKKLSLDQQLRSLLKQAKDQNSPYFGWPLLSIAVLHHQTELVERLLRQGKSPLEGNENDAISVAIDAGQFEILAKLLSHIGAKATEPEIDKVQSWLRKAVRSGNLDVLKALTLKFRTAINLHKAPTLSPNWKELVKKSSLGYAIDLGQHEAAGPLFDNLSPSNRSGLYLLFAIQKEQMDMAIALIDNGFDVTAKDELGRDSLWYAADSGHSGLLAKLLAHKAQVNRADKQGVTPLMRAVAKDCYGCTELLLEAGSDISKTAESGYNPLMFAATGKVKILALLLKNLSPKRHALSARNRQSLTPLMLAVKSQSAQCVVLLVAAGANPYRKNAQGQNAYDLAQGNAPLLTALGRD